jgi:polyisoprenoid-binding protein YceI
LHIARKSASIRRRAKVFVMKSRLVLAALVIVLVAAPAAGAVKSTDPADLPAGHYALDKAHGSLIARISHMGFSRYTVRFNRMDAQFDYDPKAPAASRLEVTVEAASIDTGSASFSKELAGSGWFDAAKYPTIVFSSKGVDLGDGQHGRIDGDLTLHGVTRPVSLDVTFNGVGSGLIPGSLRTGFSATGVIKRSDFGMTRYATWVGDEVSLQIEAEFTRK